MKLANAIQSYVENKKNDGLLYQTQGARLQSFGKHLGDIELRDVATTQILVFLDGSKISTRTWRSKYAQLEHFFRFWYLRGVTPQIQMPAPRGMVRPTFTPYIYSRSEIRALLQATRQVRQSAISTMIHPETFRTMLLFFYGTGARTSEVVELLAEDVDLDKRVMCLRSKGTSYSRSLPIGPDLWRILNQYSKWKRAVRIEGESFLLRRDGRPLSRNGIYRLFQKLLLQAGVVRRDHAPLRPRICDLRPTFAVHQITSWIRRGRNLNRLLPALSGYLGQADLTGTERFLSLTPERFKRELDKLSPQQGERWSANSEIMNFLSDR
jgi:integrase/recombinase XerD